MTQDAFTEFKLRQKEMWTSYEKTATFTTVPASELVKFSGIKRGDSVLDVGTGTGVAAITAARAGAKVTALDLTPELLELARKNSSIASISDITWVEGDAEKLQFPDASFDVVISQFGHMFAPRPNVVMAEMRRVLKPNGRIAFSTWPPEHFTGQMFNFVGRHSGPGPVGSSPPSEWGNPAVITQRLGNQFGPAFFARKMMLVPALSLSHFRAYMENSIGPMRKVIESLADYPDKLKAVRQEFDSLVEPYYDGNQVHQEYILTRATAI